MKLIKEGIAKTVPTDKAAEYRAAGWVDLPPAVLVLVDTEGQPEPGELVGHPDPAGEPGEPGIPFAEEPEEVEPDAMPEPEEEPKKAGKKGA